MSVPVGEVVGVNEMVGVMVGADGDAEYVGVTEIENEIVAVTDGVTEYDAGDGVTESVAGEGVMDGVSDIVGVRLGETSKSVEGGLNADVEPVPNCP